MNCLCTHQCHEFNSDGACGDCGCMLCCGPTCEAERYASTKMPRASYQRVRELNDYDAVRAAESPAKPVVLLLYNGEGIVYWHMKPEFVCAAETLMPGVMCFKSDLFENPRLFSTFGLGGSPAILVFRKGTEMGERLYGAITAEKIVSHVKRAIKVRA